MSIFTFRKFYRAAGGLLALVFFFTLLPLPAAYADGVGGAAGEPAALTASDVTDMGLADEIGRAHV